MSKGKRQIIKDHIYGVPDLAVEVVSRGSWRRDRIDKKALSEQFGLPEYWIVDPESRTIEVFVLTKGAYHLFSRAEGADSAKSKVVPGFAVSFHQLEI